MFNVYLTIGSNQGIGSKNKWGIMCQENRDILYREITDAIVIVGRVTYELIPKLPCKIIHVLSRKYNNNTLPVKLNKTFKVFPTVELALIAAKSQNIPIYVIGGHSVFQYVFKNYLTDIMLRLAEFNQWIFSDYYLNWNLNNFVTICTKTISMTALDEDETTSTDYVEITTNGNETSEDQIEIANTTFTFSTLRHENSGEFEYIQFIRKVLHEGTYRDTTLNLFGGQIEIDLRNGFPILTSRRMLFRSIIGELLMYIRGDTDTSHIEGNNVYWHKITSREYLDSIGMTYRKEGFLGPMYGYNWRSYGSTYNELSGRSIYFGIDQLSNVVNMIKFNPSSRKIMMVGYNPETVSQCVITPTHSIVTQFYVDEEYLDCKTYVRACELTNELPRQMVLYSLLLHMISTICNLSPRKLYISLGESFIERKNINTLSEQIDRRCFKLPQLSIPTVKTIADIEKMSVNDVDLINYQYHSKMSFEF